MEIGLLLLRVRLSAPVLVIVRPPVTVNCPEVKVMVSGIPSVKVLPIKLIVSPLPGSVLASKIACRREPGPPSFVLVTKNWVSSISVMVIVNAFS